MKSENSLYKNGNLMKKILSFTAIFFLIVNNIKAQNLQVTDPPDYPYGIDIKTTYSGLWSREFSFSRNNLVKLFSFGILGNENNLTYGYIGGNSSAGTSYNQAWMTFLPSGNIGIGTINPSRKLQVVGDASFSDVVYFNRTGANLRLRSDGSDAKDAALFTDVSGNIYLSDWNSTRGLIIKQDGNSYFRGGNLGIGTNNPIQNFVFSDNGGDGLEVFLKQPLGTVGIQAYNRSENAYKQMLFSSSGFSFLGGNVGINTAANNNYKLAVNGPAIFTKAVVKNYSNWPDYVFDSSYQLPSLDSVSSFIQVNKHLPDMPSAATVEKDGHDLGEVQKQLLKKVEELTLYMIEQNKKIANQDKEIAELKQLLKNENRKK